MNNAHQIAGALDRHLTAPAHIVVFGSSALLLDTQHCSRLTARITNDIDVVIPKDDVLTFSAESPFWPAQERVNRELEAQGLYLTHIFPEEEVVLSEDWRNHLVALPHAAFQRLTLSRPRMLDLILSKMGRGDQQDVRDVITMVNLEFVPSCDLDEAAKHANVPAIYQDIFPVARAAITDAVQRWEDGYFERVCAEVRRQKERHPLASASSSHPVIREAHYRKETSASAAELLLTLQSVRSLKQRTDEPRKQGPTR